MNRNTKNKPVDTRAANGIDGKALVEAIKMLSKERNISEDKLFAAVEEAMRTAYKKNLPKGAVEPSSLSAQINRTTGEVRVYARMVVTDEEVESVNQMSLEDAKRLQPAAQAGDIIEVDVTPSGFLRVAAQSAKQVLMQRIREAERNQIADEFATQKDEIITGVVQRVDENGAMLELGHIEGYLDKASMIPGEELHEGDRIKVYVTSVQASIGKGGAQVQVSRISQNLIRRLFEMQVEEIARGEVVIKNVAREAGSRSKISVYSSNINIDPVGACVGKRGERVDKVVAELRGEKIDIIKWSDDPANYVANALNPAHVQQVYISDTEKTCRVIVPDNQLSLAIGKEGQNARLAAKLTGWKIDIKSESQAMELTDMVDDQGNPDPLVHPMAPMEYEPLYDAGDDETL